jgi:hypothetical protein
LFKEISEFLNVVCDGGGMLDVEKLLKQQLVLVSAETLMNKSGELLP